MEPNTPKLFRPLQITITDDLTPFDFENHPVFKAKLEHAKEMMKDYPGFIPWDDEDVNHYLTYPAH